MTDVDQAWLRQTVAVQDCVYAAWCRQGQHAGIALGGDTGACPVCTPFYDSIHAPDWAQVLIWVNGDD